MTTEQQPMATTATEYVYEHAEIALMPEGSPPPSEPPAAAPPPPPQELLSPPPTNNYTSPQEQQHPITEFVHTPPPPKQEPTAAAAVGMLKEDHEQPEQQHSQVSHDQVVATAANEDPMEIEQETTILELEQQQQQAVLSAGYVGGMLGSEELLGQAMDMHPVPSPTTIPPAKKRRTGTKRSAARPWNDMLFELLRFRLMHGHVMVPFKSGGELGKWVANQRAQHVGLQKSIVKDESMAKTKWLHSEGTERLTEERMKVLSSIGFIWDVVQADNDARWKKRYEELLHYKAVNGHCNVPQSTDLGKWVKMQRENKHEADLKKAGTTPLRKKPKPCLSQSRIDKLEAIGFQWRVAKPAVGWDKRFQQLEDYKSEHGDCNVPQSFPPDKPFGRWVMKQRCQHSLKLRGEKSQLTDERERKLNDIGFSWVAPGFSKKTVTMPGEEEVDVHAHLHTLQVHALQNAVHQEVVVAQDMVVPAHHHQDEYSSWGV